MTSSNADCLRQISADLVGEQKLATTGPGVEFSRLPVDARPDDRWAPDPGELEAKMSRFPTTRAKVSTANGVLATPGTPSSSTCPLDSRPT